MQPGLKRGKHAPWSQARETCGLIPSAGNKPPSPRRGKHTANVERGKIPPDWCSVWLENKVQQELRKRKTLI